MAVVQCSNLHYYDNEKYGQCPHCAKLKKTGMAYEEEDFQSQQVAEYAAAYIRQKTGSSNPAMENVAPPVYGGQDDGKTVGLFQNKKGKRLPTGWLVCTEGEDYGSSFMLASGKNFIGSAANMDIVLHGDADIAWERHAIVFYEPKKREFFIQTGETDQPIYLNGKEIEGLAGMHAHDVLKIGKSVLVFFPCCSKTFSWDDLKKEE